LWFIGGGLEASHLRPLIERLKTDNVLFKGSFSQSRLHELYAKGSVFVLASVSDGFGMV